MAAEFAVERVYEPDLARQVAALLALLCRPPKHNAPGSQPEASEEDSTVTTTSDRPMHHTMAPGAGGVAEQPIGAVVQGGGDDGRVPG